MNFLHVSDLHIGKRLCGKSLLEDQRHILDEILEMAAGADIDALLIAGDIYDKAQPGSDAVELADSFLTGLAALKKPCFIVSGNHDSAEQVAYGRSILSGADIHISPAYSGPAQRHVLRDAEGEIHVYLLPFLRPLQVRRAHPERAKEISSYADALRAAVEEMHLDPSVRNVLVAHQYVTGASEAVLADSEEHMVGGVDAVPAEIFEAFDYVALGHLHSPQRVKGERIRYAGSPLKYSLSEEKQKKAALKVHVGAEFSVKRLEYHPLRDVKSLRGKLSELTENTYDNDYVFVSLTDDAPQLDPLGTLLVSYPNLVQYRVERPCSGEAEEFSAVERVEELSPLEHFVRFFAVQNGGQEPSPRQLEIMRQVIEEAEVKRNASR